MSEFPPAPPKHARDCTVGNDALGCNCKPTPLHGEVERLLIGMVRTTYPADRTEYERGWNEALHAARKKVAAYVPAMTIGDSAADSAPTPDPLPKGCGECMGWPGHHRGCSLYGIPRTEAGAELLRMLEDSIYKGGGLHVGRDAIVAIEDEAEHRAANRRAPTPDPLHGITFPNIAMDRDGEDGSADLDAAWAEAEAALPEGWEIARTSRVRMAGLEQMQRWEAMAAPVKARGRGWRGTFVVQYADGLTPAAALLALAAALRKFALASKGARK